MISCRKEIKTYDEKKNKLMMEIENRRENARQRKME